jgi:hypothetical protein
VKIPPDIDRDLEPRPINSVRSERAEHLWFHVAYWFDSLYETAATIRRIEMREGSSQGRIGRHKTEQGYVYSRMP